MSDKAKIYLRKTIKQDSPSNTTVKAILAVLRTENIAKEIFVCKYIPPRSATIGSYYEYNNVAYIDELKSVPTYPQNPMRASFVRIAEVTYSCANVAKAELWCNEVFKEVQRLLTTYNMTSEQEQELFQDVDNSLVTIEDSGITVEPYIIPSSYSSSSSEQSSNTPVTLVFDNTDVMTLTFDGSPVEG